jgi:nucleoside-diphosphate-sugar epimerase
VKILVTGGLGFIGHELVRALEYQEHSVTVVDSNTNYNFIPKDELDALLKERQSRIICNQKIGDIRDQKYIENVLEVIKPNVVIHLASFPRQKVVLANPGVASEVMSTGLINLLEASKGIVDKFVYVSSSMVYGDFKDGVKETAECNPIGQYAIMKLMGEQLVKDYHRQGHFDYTIIRPSAVYGPRDVEDRVLSKFVLGAMRHETLKVKGATEVLDFTYVTDTAQGIALAATKDCKHDTYNITRCENTPISLEKAALACVDLIGRGSIELLDRDINFPSRGRLNIDRARKDLNYNPTVDFTEGLENYYNWINESEYWNEKL